jgi:hypothetical protein
MNNNNNTFSTSKLSIYDKNGKLRYYKDGVVIKKKDKTLEEDANE